MSALQTNEASVRGQGQRCSLRRKILLTLVLLALVGLGVEELQRWHMNLELERRVVFVIPKGMAVLQANGKDPPMLPATIILTVGQLDTIVIRNEDVWPVRIGPFKIGPGQQYTQRFRRPGQVKLICSTMYHREQTRITVRDHALGDLWRWFDGFWN